MLKTMRKHGVTLALFAAGSTGLTAAIDQLTKNTIADQAAKQQNALFQQVIPADRYNNDLLQSCYWVTAPELGKGTHKVYIARQGEQAVGRRDGSYRTGWLLWCYSASGRCRLQRHGAGQPGYGTS